MGFRAHNLYYLYNTKNDPEGRQKLGLGVKDRLSIAQAFGFQTNTALDVLRMKAGMGWVGNGSGLKLRIRKFGVSVWEVRSAW